MKRVGTALATCCALLSLTTPAAAAETGKIVGRVVNATKDRPQPGVEVTLTGAQADGSDRMTRTVTTDRAGRYTFDELSTGEERMYVIDADYQGGFFPSRALSLPADTRREPVIDTTLRVWETTTDPTAVLITRDDMFAVLGEQGVRIIESVTVVNQTDLAYIGRGAGQTGDQPAPSLGFSLAVDCNSTSVSIVDSDLDLPQLRCTDFGFGVTTAIPPGETRTTFSYDISGDTGTFNLSRTALYDIAEMSVFAADPLVLDTNRLVERDEVTLAGKEYRRWSSRSAIDPGDSVQVIATATADLNVGLIAGAVATVVVAIGLLAFGLKRRRSQREEEAPTHPGATPGDDIVRAIAELDVAYEKGDLSEEDWSARRSSLKEQFSSGGGR